MKQKALFRLFVMISVLVLSSLACGTSSSVPKVECEPKTFTGKGDSVIDVGQVGGCTKATLTHDGTRNFIVVPYDANNSRRSSLVNEIGKYSGTVKWDAKADTLEIKADGSWSISVE